MTKKDKNTAFGWYIGVKGSAPMPFGGMVVLVDSMLSFGIHSNINMSDRVHDSSGYLSFSVLLWESS